MTAPSDDPGPSAWRLRLDALLEKGRTLEGEGCPFPADQLQNGFEEAMRAGQPAQAANIVRRGEALLARVSTDWTWVRELLRRADELRLVAQTIGVDLAHLDNRVGNPRRRLMTEPLSSGSLERAAASASLALAVLNDAIPEFCLQDATPSGASIRRARDRGEEVLEATRSFSRLIQALQDQNLSTAAQRLVELRRAVARIPKAPAIATVRPSEEEEILLEARNLARRLQRIKGKAQNAQSAARLMAQVRAAISEERRYGTPEEEIEALWAEVDRLTKEKRRASEGPPLAYAVPVMAGQTLESEEPGSVHGAPEMTDGPAAGPVEGSEPTKETEGVHPEPDAPPVSPEAPAENGPDAAPKPEAEGSQRGEYRPSMYVPYLPPDLPSSSSDTADPSTNARARTRSRSRP